MATRIEISPKVARLFQIFEKEGTRLYLVGGSVRDALRSEAKEGDLDFATPDATHRTRDILKKHGLPAYLVGAKFGTVGSMIDESRVEITTFRSKEQYTPGNRRPEVQFGKSIEEDLSRRDFTVNAMASEASGEVIDPFGGERDLREKVLRLTRDDITILEDDPLRTLRAARFVSQLGLQPNAFLRDSSRARSYLILFISRERWKQEMDKLLVGPQVEQGLEYMLDSRLMHFMIPEVASMVGFQQTSKFHHKDLWVHTKTAVKNGRPDPTLRWALLLHDVGKVHTREYAEGEVTFHHHELLGRMMGDGVLRRFRFSNEERQKILFLIENHLRPVFYQRDWTDSAVRRLVREAGVHLPDLLEHARCDVTSARPERVRDCLDRLEHLKGRVADLERANALAVRLPKGLGTEIMKALGIPAGPEVGRLRAKLEEAVTAGEIAPGLEPQAYIDFIKKSGLAAPSTPAA